MKPAFALSFSSTGISLHHLADGDWFCVGEVSVDALDLNAQLQTLREQGFALENNLRCKIVLPASQVRFLAVESTADDPALLNQRVQAALSEATPYALDELVYDTAIDGPKTYIAAVARQTLQEAQTFAVEHGFIPVQFTAPTNEQEYPAEPQFSLEVPAQVDAKEESKPEESAAHPVHAIAASSVPADFRSAPSPKPQGYRVFSRSTSLGGYALPIGAAVFVGAALMAWALIAPDGDNAPEVVTTQTEETPSDPVLQPEKVTAPDTVALETPPTNPPTQTEDNEPDLSPTDAAILEALKVAPTIVEQVARDPEPEPEPVQKHAGARIVTPEPLAEPALEPDESQSHEFYLTSIDRSDLSRDALALPAVSSFNTDTAFVALAPITEREDPETQFDLDDRGLVTATADGTLNPDGVVVYLGRPTKVPPEAPVRFEEEPILEDTNARLALLRPKPRPTDLIERFERQQLGGRTREELASVRPKLRPKSVQDRPQVDETPTALAVVRVPRPKPRPAGLTLKPQTSTAKLGSTAAVPQKGDEAGSFQAKSVAPKIPSSASVARQATIDNAINLRKLNLIGVYGTPSNRRALVRLPSGRYKKLKVGDRIDGGNVIAISDSELRYQKRGQNVTLRMPRS